MTAAPSRELALGVLGFLDTTAPQFVRTAHDAGFDSVSLRVCGSRMAVAADLTQHPELIAETLDALTSTGVRVLDVEVLRLRADVPGGPSLDQRANAALALAAQVGARNIIVINEDLNPDECARAVRRVCDLACAAGLDIRVCLEFMVFSATPDLAAAAHVVRQAEHPSAAVLVDTLHLVRTGGAASDLRAAADVMAPYVQVCGIPSHGPAREERDALITEATTARRLPGRGTLGELVVLRAVPSNCAVSLEAPRRRDSSRSPRDRARAGMRALRASIEGLQ